MAAYRSSVLVKLCLFLVLTFAIVSTKQLDDDKAKEKAAAEKENKYHAIDTAFLLVMMFFVDHHPSYRVAVQSEAVPFSA